MVHPRTTIREAAVTLIAGGSTSAGSNVSDSRVRPEDEADLPSVRVLTIEDDFVEWESMATRGFIRDLRLRFECRVATKTTMARALDTLCREVEDLLEGDPTLGGLAVHKLEYLQTSIDLSSGTDPISGLATIDYSLQYLDNSAF